MNGTDWGVILLLGVSLGWSDYKGLDVFVELANKIDDSNFRIVLVGVDDSVKNNLPNSIIAIGKTSSKQELAEIYTAADFFINPTREDTYPTVNCEAIACGTPVISFDTGGSKETLNGYGIVTPGKTADDIIYCVHEMIDNKRLYSPNTDEYNQEYRFADYLKVYE